MHSTAALFMTTQLNREGMYMPISGAAYLIVHVVAHFETCFVLSISNLFAQSEPFPHNII